jgi:hypothetical protein
MNRQIDPAAARLDAPMGVLGYRIDAREHVAAAWSSLCRASGVVKARSKVVGNFDGEVAIETIPAQPDGEKTGVYWLPSYYTHWTGPSLVAVDVVNPAVGLQYGRTYEFRVRLMDHAGGGPAVDGAPQDPGPSIVYPMPFRRWIRPAAVRVIEKLPNVSDPAKAPNQIHVGRPLLGHPEYDFTGAPNAAADLIADIPSAKAAKREVALPDPDVSILQITVKVLALALDDMPGGGEDSGYHLVYKTTRPFPADRNTPLQLDFHWLDVKNVDSLALAPATGPIPLPTARDMRLVLSAQAKDDPQLRYFGADDVRFGSGVSALLRKQSSDERGLLLPETPSALLRAVFLQPGNLVDAAVAFAQRAGGLGVEAPANAIGGWHPN